MLEELTALSPDVFGMWVPVTWGEAQITMVRGFGGDVLNDEGTQSTILEPEAKQAYSFMSSLINDLHVHPRPADLIEGGANQMFVAERIAMFSTGPWGVYTLREMIEEGTINWDMFLIPKGPAGRAGQLVTEGYPIPTNANNKDLAWQFIKLMCSAEEGLARIPYGFIAPPRTDAMLDPSLMEDSMYALYHQEMVDNTPEGAALPHNARVPEFFQLLNQGFDALWLGRAGVDETLEEVHRQIEGILARSTP
jgi:multiple sugar transport system substrate-binding protein